MKLSKVHTHPFELWFGTVQGVLVRAFGQDYCCKVEDLGRTQAGLICNFLGAAV